MIIKTPYVWMDDDEVYAAADEGWRPLLEKLFSDFDVVLRGSAGAKVRILQIKEKFGGLRFYFRVSGIPDVVEEKLRSLSRRAEDASFALCEVCGAPGKLRNDKGWWHTRCNPHK
jgi:hypothetical protein